MIELGFSSDGSQVYLNTGNVSMWFDKNKFIKAINALEKEE